MYTIKGMLSGRNGAIEYVHTYNTPPLHSSTLDDVDEALILYARIVIEVNSPPIWLHPRRFLSYSSIHLFR